MHANMKWRALPLLLLWSGYLAGGIPTLQLINDNFGNFLFVEGAMLGETTFNITADSLCTCRKQCYAKPGCKAASLVEEGSAKVCRLSFKKLQEMTFVEQENTNLMLWNTTEDGFFWMGVDGRVYLTLNHIVKAKNTVALCLHIPGFRLGSFSSLKSMEALKEFCDRHSSLVSIDLSRDNIWGNGEPYVQENSLYQQDLAGGYNYGVVRSGEIAFGGKDMNVRLLCQANLTNATPA